MYHEVLTSFTLGNERLDTLSIIRALETSGHIAAYDTKLLEDSCVMLRKSPGVHLGVNVSPLTIETKSSEIKKLLRRFQDVVPRLVIEVVERRGDASLNFSAIKTFINNVHIFGGKVALDDIDVIPLREALKLMEASPDIIKFTGGVYGNPVKMRTLSNAAKARGIQIVIEGVENRSDALRAGDDVMIQGYLLGRPQPTIKAPEHHFHQTKKALASRRRRLTRRPSAERKRHTPVPLIPKM